MIILQFVNIHSAGDTVKSNNLPEFYVQVIASL